jgi:hypothetical protein
VPAAGDDALEHGESGELRLDKRREIPDGRRSRIARLVELLQLQRSHCTWPLYDMHENLQD